MQRNGAPHSASKRAVAGRENFDRHRKIGFDHSHLKATFTGAEAIDSGVMFKLCLNVRITRRYREPPTANIDRMFCGNYLFSHQPTLLDVPVDFACEPDIQELAWLTAAKCPTIPAHAQTLAIR